MFMNDKFEIYSRTTKTVREYEINMRNFRKVFTNNKFENMFAYYKYCLRIWKKCP